jgi:hypothetical protein
MIAPLELVSIMLLPATKLADTVIALATLLIAIPLPAKGVGLALANKLVKLSLVLLKAAYSESLPVDSLGSPILICCKPCIAIYISPV